MLQSMGLQRVGYNLVTEQQNITNWKLLKNLFIEYFRLSHSLLTLRSDPLSPKLWCQKLSSTQSFCYKEFLKALWCVLEVPKNSPWLLLTVTASRLHNCHFSTTSATTGRACSAPVVRGREYSFPLYLWSKDERSPGTQAQTAETGPPRCAHSPFPSLGSHAARWWLLKMGSRT